MRPQTARRAPDFAAPSPSERGPRQVEPGAHAHASPARDLQSTLAESFDASPEQTDRWPAALRLLVIGGGSTLLWALLIAGFRAIF